MRRESNGQSPPNRREGHSPRVMLGSSRGLMRGQSDSFDVGGNLSPESKRFLKAMMTSGHPERDPLPLKEPLEAFGPALPPNLPVQSSSRRKRTSHRSSPSSQGSSRCSSSSSSSTSSCSEERKRSKERSSRRHEDRRKAFKNKKQKRSRSRDKSSQRKRDSAKASGSSNLKIGTTTKLEKNSASRKRLMFTEVNRKRNRQDEYSLDRSPERKRRKVTPTAEKSRKRVQDRSKDSERRSSHGSLYGKKKSMADVKRNSTVHESKTSLINYSTSSSSSSSSRSDREHRSPEAKQKPDAKQNTKEASTTKEANTNKAPASGETLQDLEQFLLELKAKKKTLSK